MIAIFPVQSVHRVFFVRRSCRGRACPARGLPDIALLCFTCRGGIYPSRERRECCKPPGRVKTLPYEPTFTVAL